MQEKKPFSPLAWLLILSGTFFLLFLGISGVFYMAQGGSSHSGRSGASVFSGTSAAVGLIEINGMILDSRKTLDKLDKLESNPDVKAVVLRLNSPGGGTAPAQEIYEAVKGYSKPVVVSMASVAASGAYYIAVGANKVFANPGTLTGSIGVVMEFLNLGNLYEWAKVKRYTVKAGKFKDSGAEFREMTDEEKELLQTAVDDVMVQFKKAVKQGRSLTDDQVSEVADGRIFTGSQALKLHLIDKLGTINDAIQEAGRLGKIVGKPRVIRTDKKKSALLDFLSDDDDGFEGVPSSSSKWATIFEILRLVRPELDTVSRKGLNENMNLGPGFYLLWNP